MTAREEILIGIRSAVGAARSAGAGPGAVPRGYRTTGDHAPGSPAVLDLLADRLEDYRATVHRVAAADAVPDTVAGLLAGCAAVVVPDGLDPAWLAGVDPGITVLRDSRAEPNPAAALDAADAVVTAARVAIAETGTIVLDGAQDQGRRAISLVPDTHVCVLLAAQVVQTVPEAVRLLAAHPDRPLTWISGPSATSDIELTRVEGVHGPRTLHVVLVG